MTDAHYVYCAECDEQHFITAELRALLRAVADEHETFAEWVGPAVMKDYDSATFNVALALADTILGVEE